MGDSSYTEYEANQHSLKTRTPTKKEVPQLESMNQMHIQVPRYGWYSKLCRPLPMPGKRRALEKSTPMGALVDKLERAKARIRAKVEHPPRVIKRQYGYIRASTGDQSKPQ
jgi:IS5 family transposase